MFSMARKNTCSERREINTELERYANIPKQRGSRPEIQNVQWKVFVEIIVSFKSGFEGSKCKNYYMTFEV